MTSGETRVVTLDVRVFEYLGCANGLDMGCEGRRGVQNDVKVFGLRNQKDAIVRRWNWEDCKGEGFWGVVWMDGGDLGFEQIKLAMAITSPSGDTE